MIHKIKTIYAMLADLWRSRQLILHLSFNDFKTRYAGSLMGVFWAFIQPIITVLVYWFVFEKGLRAGAQAMGGLQVPFVLFLLSGGVVSAHAAHSAHSAHDAQACVRAEDFSSHGSGPAGRAGDMRRGGAGL